MTDLAAPVRLDDLIAAVNQAHQAPLDRVGGAVELSGQLGETADALVGYFVDQARRSGATWAEIGGSMGVTKQAAQKRFVARASDGRGPLDASQGFSRFDTDARTAVVRAQELARAGMQDTVTVGHLTLAIMEDRSSLAVRSVAAQGVAIEDVIRVAEATLPEAAAEVPALIPFDAHTQSTLKLAFSIAERLQAEMIKNEHLLLAIMEADDGTGVLAGLGVQTAAIVDLLTQ